MSLVARRIAILVVLLAAAWLLWSGIYKPLLLGLGLLSCALATYIAHRTDFFKQSSGLHLLPKLPRYWAWLIAEVVKSSIEVARIVLDPKLPISPTIIEIDAEPEGPIGQVILGNSISLSPGTVTLDVHNNRLRVHCLTKEGAASLRDGDANRRSAELTTK